MSLIDRWLKPIWKGMDEKNTLGLAAQMAFWVFLSLVPLAAIVGFVAARLAVTHHEDVLGPILESVPAATSQLIVTQVEHVAKWQGGTVAPVAITVFVWLASSGIHSVFDAIEAQTGTRRPWWKKRVCAIAVCCLLSLGTALVGLLGAGFGWIEGFIGAHVLGRWVGGALDWIVRVAVAVLVAFALLCALYWSGLPSDARKRMPIWPGAALALALQIAMGFAYGEYIARMGIGDAYLAGLAVVGVTLMLLYLYSLAVLIGAELNRVIGEQRDAARTGIALAASEASCSPSRESSPRPTSPSRPTAPSTTPSSSPSG
jgi:membrane protein